MPKKPLKLKIVAYDKNNEFFAERTLFAYQYSKAFEEFNKYVGLLTGCKFTYIGRLDLVDCERILFSCVSFRHVLNQKNYSINFNPF